MTEIIVRYLHFTGIMCVMASLVAEHLLVSREASPKQLQRLSVINTIYGISIALVFLTGFLTWFAVGLKPTEYYTANWLFHIKVTLFVIVALLSVHPTMFLMKNKHSQEDTIQIPKSIIMVIRLELLLMLVLPLLAVLMTRGHGIIDSN